MKQIISVVAPAYNEEDVVEKFYYKITSTLLQITNYDYEMCIRDRGFIIFVKWILQKEEVMLLRMR